jgi:hypothetical protein
MSAQLEPAYKPVAEVPPTSIPVGEIVTRGEQILQRAKDVAQAIEARIRKVRNGSLNPTSREESLP